MEPMSVKIPNGVKEVQAFMMYMHNTRPADIVALLFGEVHSSYEQEWMERYRDFGLFWRKLDDNKRVKLMEAALTKYG